MSDDDFDDLPETHLDDEDYDEFVARTFDTEGRLKGSPPVGWIIAIIMALLLILAVLWFT